MSVVARNHINVSGDGAEAVMFSHGFGCDQTMWRYVTPAFKNRYSVVLFDHVGSGRSDLSAYSPARYRTLHAYAEDVVQICAELGLTKLTFVGHSVSAMIGVLAAKLHPDLFTRLVLVCPSPCYVNDGAYVGGFTQEEIEAVLDSLDDNYLGWSTTMAPVIMGNPERPELTDELADSFCRNDPAIARQFARVAFLSDHREDLPDVRVPTLVMQCASDPLAPRAVGEYTHSRLASSDLLLMKATGHCPHLSAPQETIAGILSFLERGESARGRND